MLLAGAALGVRLGDGAGGFGPATSQPYAVGYQQANPEAVALDDLDSDGDLDVVVTGAFVMGCGSFGCQVDERVSALLNNGSGGFTSVLFTLAPTEDIAVGDLDEDGHRDIVVAGHISSPDEIGMFLGNGAGGFLPIQLLPAGTSACSAAIDDFNDDGHLDLVVGTSPTGGRVLFGAGDETFPRSDNLITAEAGTQDRCSGVVRGDVDGDAQPDVAFLGYRRDDVAVMLNRLTAG